MGIAGPFIGCTGTIPGEHLRRAGEALEVSLVPSRARPGVSERMPEPVRVDPAEARGAGAASDYLLDPGR
jgi:hypothetical protein